MKLFLLVFCLFVFVVNARAQEEEQNHVTQKQQEKSIGEGAEHPAMTKEDRKAMHADKHKMKKEMKKAMKEAKEKEKAAIRKAHEAHKAAAKKKPVDAPPVPTEDQIKKADAEDDEPASED